MDILNKILSFILSAVFSVSVALPGRLPCLPGKLGTGLAMEGVYGLIGLMHGGPKTAGLVVLRGGEIVYERYGRGQNKDTPHAMYSGTKSVVSALVGIAIGEGKIKSVDQKVIDFFPDAAIAAGRHRDKIPWL